MGLRGSLFPPALSIKLIEDEEPLIDFMFHAPPPSVSFRIRLSAHFFNHYCFQMRMNVLGATRAERTTHASTRSAATPVSALQESQVMRHPFLKSLSVLSEQS